MKIVFTLIAVFLCVNSFSQTKAPITIDDFDYYNQEYLESSYSLYFNVKNNSKKTIKYIKIVTKAINPVGDRVKDMYSGAVTKKVEIVGPIPTDNYGDVEFKGVWNSNILDKIEIVSISVQFMDNTIVNVSPKAALERKPENIVHSKRDDVLMNLSEYELKNISIATVEREIDIEIASEKLGIEIETLKRLNPDQKNIINGRHVFRFPKEKIYEFIEMKESLYKKKSIVPKEAYFQ